MPILKTSAATSNALSGIWNLSLTVFILATLCIGRDLLIPLALAALLTFLLTPLVTWLERWLGRVGAVLIVVTLILIGAAGSAWVLTRQIVDLATRLPDYKENIQDKLRSVRVRTSGRYKRFAETIQELERELPGARPPRQMPTPPVSKSTQVASPRAITPGLPEAVESRPSGASPIQLLRSLIAPLLGPLGTAGLVSLLVIFMLLKREDLRSRLIRLIGQGRISGTTRAMDDAGARVTRYLLMQLVVNVTYGALVAVGLQLIRVPNGILWGACATVLRFIPYVGPWIGAAIPIVLSLIAAPGWLMPALTVSLFVVLELLSNNVMEPWLYGSSTGVSPVALIVGAVIWTWLWGPVGLVLATPMTVCLVVMGRHIPNLSFLSVVLSDEEALTPAEDCYYRLLTVGEQGEMDLVESYARAHSLTALYDSVLIPVITAVEIDHRLDLLQDGQRVLVEQNLRDIVDDLGSSPRIPAQATPEGPANSSGPARSSRVLCLPARADRDELAGIMLVQLLQRQGFEASVAPARLDIEEMIRLVENFAPDVVCISVVAPSTVLHARFLCLRLRPRLPSQQILVGLWGSRDNIPDATRRIRDSGADQVVTTLADAVQHLGTFVPVSSRPGGAPATPVTPAGSILPFPTDHPSS